MQTMKVLAVDDSNVVLDFVKKVLVPLGYTIETAENGAQALDKYSKLKPDVVTLDLAMPVLDGFETLTKILKIDRSAKVIVVTASGNRDLVDKCLQKGAVGFIEKPFLPDQLTSVITNALIEPLDIHKNTVTVFSLAGQKMDASLKTMFDGSISVRLNSAKIYIGASASGPAAEVPKLQAVAHQEVALEGDLLPTGDLSDYLGFLTEVEGANEASVTSFMLKRDLAALLDVTQEDASGLKLKSTELFNVLNNKLLGELGSALHIPLDTGLTKICDPDAKYNPMRPSGNSEIIRAKYVIIYNGKMMPLVVELRAKVSRN